MADESIVNHARALKLAITAYTISRDLSHSSGTYQITLTGPGNPTVQTFDDGRAVGSMKDYISKGIPLANRKLQSLSADANYKKQAIETLKALVFMPPPTDPKAWRVNQQEAKDHNQLSASLENAQRAEQKELPQPHFIHATKRRGKSPVWETPCTSHHGPAGIEQVALQLLDTKTKNGLELKPPTGKQQETVVLRRAPWPWALPPHAYYNAWFNALFHLPVVPMEGDAQHLVPGANTAYRIRQVVACVHAGFHPNDTGYSHFPASYIQTWVTLAGQNKITPPTAPGDASGLQLSYRWKRLKYRLQKFLYHDEWDYTLCMIFMTLAAILSLLTLTTAFLLTSWSLWLGTTLTSLHYFAIALISVPPSTLLLWGLVFSFALLLVGVACVISSPATGMSTRRMKAGQDAFIEALRQHPKKAFEIIATLKSGEQLTLWNTKDFEITQAEMPAHCRTLFTRLTDVSDLADHIDLCTAAAETGQIPPQPAPRYSRLRPLNFIIGTWKRYNYWFKYESEKTFSGHSGVLGMITNFIKKIAGIFTIDFEKSYQLGEKPGREQLAYKWWYHLTTNIQADSPTDDKKGDPGSSPNTQQQYKARLDMYLLSLISLNGFKFDASDQMYVRTLLEQRPQSAQETYSTDQALATLQTTIQPPAVADPSTRPLSSHDLKQPLLSPSPGTSNAPPLPYPAKALR